MSSIIHNKTMKSDSPPAYTDSFVISSKYFTIHNHEQKTYASKLDMVKFSQSMNEDTLVCELPVSFNIDMANTTDIELCGESFGNMNEYNDKVYTMDNMVVYIKHSDVSRMIIYKDKFYHVWNSEFKSNNVVDIMANEIKTLTEKVNRLELELKEVKKGSLSLTEIHKMLYKQNIEWSLIEVRNDQGKYLASIQIPNGSFGNVKFQYDKLYIQTIFVQCHWFDTFSRLMEVMLKDENKNNMVSDIYIKRFSSISSTNLDGFNNVIDKFQFTFPNIVVHLLNIPKDQKLPYYNGSVTVSVDISELLSKMKYTTEM
jgi:hypothetical protein